MTAPPDDRDLLAHDIRAALSDVIGGLRLVEGARLPPEIREQLDRMQSAGELLARLIEALLDGDDGGAAETSFGNLNLPRFLEAELRRWRGAAQPMGVRVRLQASDDLPGVVRLNSLHLHRVVSNLMGNALRHAPRGTVTLCADVTRDGTLSIRVADSGPGFTAARLADPFGHGAPEGPGRGSGMGLHIAAAHAEALQGCLTLDNRPGGGAMVELRVPSDAWRRATADEARPDILNGRRVLVADDSGTIRTLACAMLERLGAECETADDGVEALNWLARERFDLALIDIEMPELDGTEVIRAERLRQVRGIAPPLAMVAMTAHATPAHRDAMREAGADGIVPKPLPPLDAFGKTLAQILAEGPDASDWAPERAEPLSAATLAELMMAAGPDYSEPLLRELRRDLEQVEAALSRALSRGDTDGIEAQTHVLLSLVGSIGALPTEQAARRLNRLNREGAGAEAIAIAGKTCLGRVSDLRAELAEIR